MRGWRGAALLAAAWAVFAQGAPPSGGEGVTVRPSVVLITLDTTRLDHLGFAGYAAAQTPVLDGLRAQGALLAGAQAHVPLTLPSHANLLTGRLPGSLGLRVNGLVLRPEVPTLATRLKERGYRTAAVVSSAILARGRGLARGFDTYDDRMTRAPRGGGPPEERTATETTDAALAVAQRGESPLFLWVHYYDPHYDYVPPQPWAARFKDHPYDGEIAYMDSEIGRLLSGLEKAGILPGALVVVAGDHGEGLGEHGERQHGVFLYNYALQVPLLFVWPGHIQAGASSKELCGLTDLSPTVMDLLGLPPGETDGRSLKPLLSGGTLPPQDHYAESYHGFFTYGWAPLRALVSPEWKYIEAPRPELYRWPQGESENLLGRETAAAAKMRKALAAFPTADSQEREQVQALLKDPSNAEAIKTLMSLGYLSGAGPAPPAKSLLDPKDAIGIETEVRQAQDWMQEGDSAKAEGLLLDILKRNPQNVPAVSVLGSLYLREEKLEKAKVCYEQQVRLKPQMAEGHLNLGSVLRRLGDRARAEKEYRAALAVDPAMGEAAANLSRLLGESGRAEEGARTVEEALRAGAESADLHFQAGLFAAQRKDFEKARFHFTRCVALDPTRHPAMANLGRIAWQSGRVDEAIAQYQRAVRLAPGSAEYLATLGSLYLNGKDDPVQALRYFRQAIAAEPYGPQAASLREIVAGLEHAGAPP